MKRLLVALLLLYPLTAVAETYEWTDELGTVHFTEDLGKVPRKYRKKARIVGEESGAPQVINEPVSGKAGAEEQPDKEKGKKVYGGKDEAAWRREFGSAKAEVQASETNLADLQGRLRDTSKMSRSEYLTIQNSIKHEELRLQGLKRKLGQLDQAADQAGVPREARQ